MCQGWESRGEEGAMGGVDASMASKGLQDDMRTMPEAKLYRCRSVPPMPTEGLW